MGRGRGRVEHEGCLNIKSYIDTTDQLPFFQIFRLQFLTITIFTFEKEAMKVAIKLYYRRGQITHTQKTSLSKARKSAKKA